jgi:hypothetical protein
MACAGSRRIANGRKLRKPSKESRREVVNSENARLEKWQIVGSIGLDDTFTQITEGEWS